MWAKYFKWCLNVCELWNGYKTWKKMTINIVSVWFNSLFQWKLSQKSYFEVSHRLNLVDIFFYGVGLRWNYTLTELRRLVSSKSDDWIIVVSSLRGFFEVHIFQNVVVLLMENGFLERSLVTR